jgi:hypothetical protein
MASQVVIRGRVNDAGDRFVGVDPAAVRRELKARAGKEIELVLRAPKSKRSIEANAYWWGVAVPMIAEDLGYDKHEHDQVHYALVSKCFGVRQDPKLGEVPNKRSSQLTVGEFSELMEWAVRFAATELGIVVPLPGEATE